MAAITAATQIGGDITVLVPGAGIDGVATNAAKINGVTKVLSANNDVSILYIVYGLSKYSSKYSISILYICYLYITIYLSVCTLFIHTS